MTNGSDSAHPQISDIDPDDLTSTGIFSSYGGLTKREHFAAMALQGIAANSYYPLAVGEGSNPFNFANEAVAFADDLIKALNVEK